MLKTYDSNTEKTTPSILSILMSLVIIVGILRYAQDIFIPIALATLLSFVITPIVTKLSQWKFPRALAILTSVGLTFSGILVLGGILSVQLVHLAQDIPQYQTNVKNKVEHFKKITPKIFSHIDKVLKAFEDDADYDPSSTTDQSSANDQSLTKDQPSANDQSLTKDQPEKIKPIPVEIQEHKTTIIYQITSALSFLLGPIGIGALVIIFVISILFNREDLRERFITLISRGNLNLATQVIDDAGHRISRYLLMNLLVNSCFGLMIGIGLYYIGVPNPILWGMLAAFLRFIPYLGLWTAAMGPAILAFAVDPGWSMFVMTIGLFLVIELIGSNVFEPWLYGASTGISSMALLVAAVFWAWLWGVVGLLLSIPLTVCIFILGKYVPGLEFLGIILGSEPVLSPESSLYQRLLAMDDEETLKMSEAYVKKTSLSECYDFLVIPALNLAEEDRHNGTLAEHRQKFILENVSELIDSIGNNEITEMAPDEIKNINKKHSVICIPARDETDELAARMLAQLLSKEQIDAFVIDCVTLNDETYAFLTAQQPAVVCISSLPPFALMPARQMYRKLKRHLPNSKIIIGIWSKSADLSEMSSRLGVDSSSLVSNLQECVSLTKNLIKPNLTNPQEPILIKNPEPILKIAELKNEETLSEDILDAVIKKTAKTLDVPISLVNLIDIDRQYWENQPILPLSEERENNKDISIFSNGVAQNEILVIEDINKDPRFNKNSWVRDRGIRFYLGVPIKSPDGRVVGTLCVIDTKPRKISEEEKETLTSLVATLTEEKESKKVSSIS